MLHMRLNLLGILAFATLAVKPHLLQTFERLHNDTTRLPNTSFPLNYTIHLTTNVHRGNYSYEGNCTIAIKVVKTTDRLVMHSKYLSINEVSISDSNIAHPNEKLNFTTFKDFLILKRANANATHFEKGHILCVKILFTGQISTYEQRGFLKMKYTNRNGREIIGAFSYFEPDSAASAFPCYDEPAYKAKFTLSLTHGSNFTAISNMPQDGEVIKDPSGATDMVTTNFLQTEIMSTYLLAFVISDLQYMQQQKSEGVPKRIFTSKGFQYDKWNIFGDIDWALETMQHLFDVQYNLKKLDFVVVDWDVAGMENWGLIYISFDDNICQSDQSYRDTFENTYMIFHELAHQWFGNLVTLEWWTYIWLNEGFATYYANVLTDLRLPKHRIFDRIRVNVCLRQLMYSAKGTISLYREDDLLDRFNDITYNKAACVIQMFEHAFGQKIFRQGVGKYLKSNLYSVVTENDLFDSLQNELLEEDYSIVPAWDYSIHEILKSWTHSASFPTISVKRDYTKANSHKVKIQQSSELGEKFWVPLTFATTTNPDFENIEANYFLKPTDQEVEIDLGALNITLKPNDWLIVNKNAIGYYKVKYDVENLRSLIKALNENRQSISPMNRASLYANIADVELRPDGDRYLSNVTLLDLELIASLEHEEDPFVWLSAAKRIRFLPIYNKYRFELLRTYLKFIIEPRYEHFHFKEQTELNNTDALLFRELQALARDLNLKTSLNDQNLTELYLKNVLTGWGTEGGESNQNWNSRICRVSKNMNETGFNSLVENFKDYEFECVKWVGFQCTQREEIFLKYLEAFNETWVVNSKCDCKFINILTFLQMDFVDTWSKAWTNINESFMGFMLNGNLDCITFLLKEFKENFLDLQPKNLLKFQDAFKDFPEFNNYYENKIQEKIEEDAVTEWLNRAIKSYNIVKQ